VNTDIFYQKTLPALISEMRAGRQKTCEHCYLVIILFGLVMGAWFFPAPREVGVWLPINPRLGTKSSQTRRWGEWIRTSGSAMRSHRQQRGPGRAA
jgi:hypothetical protein